VRSWWRPAVSGVLAVAVALALTELAAGLVVGVPSLIDAVGSLLIPFVPPGLESWAIATFGTSDKAVLTAVTTVIALALGAVVGVRARDRSGTAVTAFGLAGGLGFLAAVAQPLTSVLATLISVVASAAIGLLLLRRLLAGAASPSSADREEPEPAVGSHPADPARRAFIAAGAGAAGAALILAVVGRGLLRSRRGPPITASELPRPVRAAPPPGPAAAFDGIEGLAPIVVPNDRFYRIDTALTVPRIDPERWRLRVHGMVEREYELTYDELLALPMVERYVTLACVSNEVGGDLVGNARWLGVPLVDVLDRAGVRDGATQLVGRAIDGWTAGFPTAAAFDGREALVAVGMNGEPLPARHGFPARLVVPGLYGYVSATKWLTELELTTLEAFDAYWVPRGWAKEAPVETQSRFDVPGRGARVPAGETVFAGVAWAPGRGIAGVEVRVDEGPWQPCEVSEPLSDDAWVQWRLRVPLPAGPHVAEVRATDGDGRVQVSRYTPPRPDGATGYDTLRLTAESS
jgi:DMSO/TMAO reductase YedYZ molybdopterin-dependent catalytic subunit